MTIYNGDLSELRVDWARAAASWLACAVIGWSVTVPQIVGAQESVRSAVQYRVLATDAPGLPIPTGKRVPFGWPAFSGGTAPVTLSVPATIARGGGGDVFLRVTTAIDDRQSRLVEVAVAGGGPALGRLDLRFAHAIETFQLAVPASAVAAMVKNGITLRLVEDGPPL